MSLAQPHAIIVGAGVSGLVAAIELEHCGWRVTLVDRHEHVGGRVATREHPLWPLDEGFQVLLTAYPHVQRYLDLEKLNLRSFLPGAACMNRGAGGYDRVGDPLRAPSFLSSAFSSRVANWSDKWKLLNWIGALRNQSIESLFNRPETSTASLLQNKGFSPAFIHRFFQPFLAGIFLDAQLNTSSRMCEFVLKMFAEGKAVVPRDGMKAIPAQLASGLTQTTLKLNAGVQAVSEGAVTLDNGEEITGDVVIIANAAIALPNHAPEDVTWASVHTLYFETPHPGFTKPLLGLCSYEGEQAPLINNFHFLGDVFPDGSGNAISVTVIEPRELNGETLEIAVARDLEQYDIQSGELLHHTHIQRALPKPGSFSASCTSASHEQLPGVFLAGDHLTNPSLQGAMESGRVAALAAVDWATRS